MSKRDWKLFIIDILECIEKIEDYMSEMSFEEFIKDNKTKDAVVRNFEIISEAAKQIPEQVRKKYAEIPWLQIIGLRHRLVHGYFVIDYNIVWNIAREEIPDLKEKIKNILKEMQK